MDERFVATGVAASGYNGCNVSVLRLPASPGHETK